VAGIADFKNVQNCPFPAGVVKTDTAEVDLFLILISTTPARQFIILHIRWFYGLATPP